MWLFVVVIVVAIASIFVAYYMGYNHYGQKLAQNKTLERTGGESADSLSKTINQDAIPQTSSNISVYTRINKGVQDSFINQDSGTLQIPFYFCVEDKPINGEWKFVACEQRPPDTYFGFRELDLREHDLPITKMLSMSSNLDGKKIAYMVYTDGEYCKDDKKGFIYDTETQKTEEINAKRILNICGAISSRISHFSEGGRYIYIKTDGETSYSLTTLYDIKRGEAFNPDIDTYTLETIGIIGGVYSSGYLMHGLSEEYIVYLTNSKGDCVIDGESPGPGCSYDTIAVKNTNTGEVKIITNSNLKYGYDLIEINDDNLIVKKYWIDSESNEYQNEQETIQKLSQYLP